MLVTLSRWLCPDYFAISRASGRPVLITLPFSHYVELARWSLRLCGVAFDEWDYSILQHVLPVLSVRVARPQKHLPSAASSARAVEPPSDGVDAPLVQEAAGGSDGATSTPLLVAPDGSVLADSWAIAGASGLRGLESRALLAMYDEELGPLARQWLYRFLLKPSNSKIWDSMLTRGRHPLYRLAYFGGLAGPIRAMMAKTFLADDAHAHAECTAKLRGLIERIGRTRLHQRGRYALGDALTLEDVALAALAGPLVLPPLYAEGRFTELVALEAADAELRAAVGEWRATDVGAYVMQLYAEHRLAPLAPELRRGAPLKAQ